MALHSIRETSSNKLAGSIRGLLALLFLCAGVVKLLHLDVWSDQLLAANIPMVAIVRWTVPFLEMALGVALAVGLFVRPAAVMIIGIMVVATYVHIVVEDPAFFPLQPHQPIVPLVVMVLSSYLLWHGAGAWSLDLKVGG